MPLWQPASAIFEYLCHIVCYFSEANTDSQSVVCVCVWHGRYSHGQRGGRCRRQEDAAVLLVRRHRQHGVAHAESRHGQTTQLRSAE